MATSLVPKRQAIAIQRLEIQRDRISRAVSYFGEHSREIYDLLQDDKNEQAIASLQKQLLASTVRMIPKAEKAYKADPKQSNANAYNTLVTTASELVASIQANADRRMISDRVVRELLKPAFTQCVQNIVTEHFTLKSRLASLIPEPDRPRANDHIDNSAKSIAQEMSVIANLLAKNIDEALTG